MVIVAHGTYLKIAKLILSDGSFRRGTSLFIGSNASSRACRHIMRVRKRDQKEIDDIYLERVTEYEKHVLGTPSVITAEIDEDTIIEDPAHPTEHYTIKIAVFKNAEIFECLPPRDPYGGDVMPLDSDFPPEMKKAV